MHADGERRPEGHGTIWGRATMERTCLRCHCHRICSVLDSHHSRRHVLQCAPRRLHSLSKGNLVVQQNPYFEQRHSAYKIPESSNIQDLHQCYDYQQFGQQLGEPVPMSIGTNVVGRNHDGSQDGMLVLTQSSGAHSGSLQQQRDTFNWSNSSLQMGPQTQLNLASVTGAPSGGRHQHRNMFSWRNTSLQTPPQAHLNLSTAPARCSVVTGVPKQHKNMLDWNDVSVELLRRTQLNFYNGRASVTTGSATGLQQQQDRIRNMYNSSNSSTFQTPPRQTELNISSGSRIMDNTAMNNYMDSQRKRRSLLTNTGSSPYNVVQPEDARMLGKDIRSSAKRPCNSWFLQNYFAGSWNQSTRDLAMGSSHCDFNNTTAQTFEHINSATAAATALEKISHDLLSDVDIEHAGVAEEAMVMSTVNSLSDLLQQDPAPATASRSSQGSYADASVTIAPPLNISAESAATTQVLGVSPDAGSSGGRCNQAGGDRNNSLSPSTVIIEGLSCEEEQMGEIEMDQAYLSEMLPFCP